jgi:hypothetical protein
MSKISVKEALNYLDTFREFAIKRDIPTAIGGGALYLAALGLSTYTEILGGLYAGEMKRDLGKHYICFINEFFHSDYMKVDRDLANDNFGGLYGAVRSGLVHEYFIKNISKIEIDSATVISCGIIYDPNNNPRIVFYVKPYFCDFTTAFDKYYHRFKNDQSGDLLRKFDDALSGINSSLISKLSKDYRQEVSGKSI